MRSSTFLVVSPFSYPKKTSSVLISAFVGIATSTPVHPRNWFTVFEVYDTVLTPEITFPVSANPTVESTVITDAPTDTGLITFV